MTTRITLLQSLVGFSITFTHLDNHKFTLTRKDVTPPGFVQVIPDEGMPVHEMPSNKGNLYVTYEIIFPQIITQAQKDAFSRLLVN